MKHMLRAHDAVGFNGSFVRFRTFIKPTNLDASYSGKLHFAEQITHRRLGKQWHTHTRKSRLEGAVNTTATRSGDPGYLTTLQPTTAAITRLKFRWPDNTATTRPLLPP